MSMRQWTTVEVAMMREQYKTLGAEKMAALLNRSPTSVKVKASRLGLRGDRPGILAWEMVILRCADVGESVTSVTRALNTAHVRNGTDIWRAESWVRLNLARERKKRGVR